MACETEAGLDVDPPSVRSNIEELSPGGLMLALVLGALGGLPPSARSRRKKKHPSVQRRTKYFVRCERLNRIFRCRRRPVSIFSIPLF